MKSKSKKTILIHTFSSILLSVLLYFFSKELAEALFFSSLVFNIYLRLLYAGFGALDLPGLAQKSKSTILIVFSGLRTAIVGALLALLILKFKLNLYGIAAGFLLYQLILIRSVFGAKAEHAEK